MNRTASLVVLGLVVVAVSAPLAGNASAAGTERCTNEAVRAQQRSEGIPDPGECRAYEMVTPPHKSNRIVGGGFNRTESHNAVPGLAAASGEQVLWGFSVFPLDGATAFPFGGDQIRLQRTPAGWLNESLLSLAPLTAMASASSTAQGGLQAASADFGVQAMDFNVPLLANASSVANGYYTRRTGTGVAGYTGWLADAEAATAGLPAGTGGSLAPQDQVLFNEDGGWMARWGYYRGLLGVTAVEDPSLTQLAGSAGGNTIYLQHAAPAGTLELVNGCTGSGTDGDATEIPSGEAGTIGTRVCEENTGELAAGTATRTANSPVLTEVDTESGAFEPGQMAFGEGITPGTVITSVGAETLTLSADPTCGQASGTANRNANEDEGPKNVLTDVKVSCGAFEVGQTLTRSNGRAPQGIPAGTTITACSPSCAEPTTLTLSADATGNQAGAEIAALGSATVPDLTARTQAIVSTGGAAMGGGNRERAGQGPATTAMSNDGRRLYFESPDPTRTFTLAQCDAQAEAAGTSTTECPPQLYLRQSEPSEAEPFAGSAVRWVSRSRSHAVGGNGYDGPMIAGQEVGLMGAGAAFEGASKDGQVVYFRTDAPLTPDDPNGAGTPPPAGGVNTGTASTDSWDLYQYRVPAVGDPGEGVLNRISGGPDGTADPDTNEAQGIGSAARYISDDGRRVYFVTTSPIPGADNTPPAGGITTPGGTPGGNVRDLYLFDEQKGGAERYRFITQLPTGGVIDGCASTAALGQGSLNLNGGTIKFTGASCFRGTPVGTAVVFETTGQLTADDTDEAGDIYLYDAESDKLTRVSAPLSGVAPYACQEAPNGEAQALCNGDLGFGWFGSHEYAELGWAGYRHYNLAEDAEGHVSVYFESRAPLVTGDANGTHWDTYQWRDGRLSLISPGDGPNDAYYSGNSVDGHDVFFETNQPIDPREIDPTDRDVYDARIGGGFPFVRPLAPCDPLAGECVGSSPASLAQPEAATSGLRGEGNAKPRRCAAMGTRAQRLSRRAKRLRRDAKGAHNPRKASQLRGKSSRLAKRARRQSEQGKRCRAGGNKPRTIHARRANHHRRAAR